MGSFLCRPNPDHLDYSIFEYRYGQDDKETKIVHNDRIETRNESIKPSLVDCQTKLKKSEKRFRDVTMTVDPVRLICGQRQIPCTFERPDVFLKREANLRNKIYRIVDKDNARPSNIIVGDQVLQYFGVFLCYLSSNPNIIDQIILTDQNSYGICALHMNIDKKRFVIYIDDYILCYEKKPVFSSPIKYTDMWPCLLEKAWFKVKSCLKTKIQKINPIQVFESFLSYPIKRYQLGESFEQNLKIVRKYLIEPCLKDSNLGCVVTSKLRPHHKIGISGRKHYYCLKIIVFDQKIYFYLRNPCGQFDFRGSVNSIPSKLEEAIVRETGENIAPGNFLLTEAEFDEQIQSFFTVMYSAESPNISEEDLKFGSSDREEVYIRFQLKKAGAVGMRLQQINSTGAYSPLTYQVLDLERNSVVSGYLNQQGCFGVEEANLMSGSYQVLMPSNYMLRIKKKKNIESINDNKGNQPHEANHRDRLIVSSNEDIKFEFSSSDQFKHQFERTLKQIAKKQLAQDKAAIRDEIEQIVFWFGDLVVVYVNKLNTGRENINLQVHFPDLKNLECLSHGIKKGYTSLPPFSQDILILFQKVNLTEETSLGKYSLTPY